MKKCYHQECDKWSQEIITNDKYEFMTSTAQSLILSIAEMAMEGHETNCLRQTVQEIVKTKSSNDIAQNGISSTDRPKRR